MSLDTTIRENLDGKYLIIHANYFNEGIEYACKIQIAQIQLRGVLGNKSEDICIDFRQLEKLSAYLRIISFAGSIGKVCNFESIYSLNNIEKIYIQQKQKFTIDVSKFPKIIHLGSEYWKGLINIEKTISLTSLVLFKLTDTSLQRISNLKNLMILHIYSSKIETLDGIETLPIEVLSLARDNYLKDIQAIEKLEKLKEVNIEKCKNIIYSSLLLKNADKINLNIS